MSVKTKSTYQVRIYMSGPIEIAKQALREYCMVGLCVTIEPTTFIYTGGEESGFVIGLLNYPRFPAKPASIDAHAHAIAKLLAARTFQHSVLIVTPKRSTWITSREDQ